MHTLRFTLLVNVLQCSRTEKQRGELLTVNEEIDEFVFVLICPFSCLPRTFTKYRSD